MTIFISISTNLYFIPSYKLIALPVYVLRSNSIDNNHNTFNFDATDCNWPMFGKTFSGNRTISKDCEIGDSLPFENQKFSSTVRISGSISTYNGKIYDKDTEISNKYIKYEDPNSAITTINSLNPHIIITNSHGDSSCIDEICSDNLKLLSNNPMCCLVSSVSCFTNNYSQSIIFKPDNDLIINNNNSPSSILLKSINGTLSCSGNTSYGWYYQGFPEEGISNVYLREFLNQLYVGESLGEAFWKSKYICHASKQSTDQIDLWIYNSLDLLGDPSFKPLLSNNITVIPNNLAFGFVNRGETKKISLDIKSDIESEVLIKPIDPWISLSKSTIKIDKNNSTIEISVMASSLPAKENINSGLILIPTNKQSNSYKIPLTISTQPFIKVNLNVGNKDAFINNIKRTLSVAPVNEKGTVMVPLRFVSEAFGCGVTWDKSKQEATVYRYDVTFKLWIGNSKAIVNGNEFNIGSSPILLNNTVMVPLRFMSGPFAAKVLWDQKTKGIQINWP